MSDWESNEINLKKDLQSKYSVVVARDKNVYDTVDIHNNKSNPKIIAKYIVENDILKIPEFNI